MGLKVSVKTDRLKALRKSLEENNQKVTLGLLKSKGSGDKPSLSQIAEWLEFGWVQEVTPKQTGYFNFNYGIYRPPGDTLFLPPRPFFRWPIQEKQEELLKYAKTALAQGDSPKHVILQMARILQAAMKSAIYQAGTESREFQRLSRMTMQIREQQAAADVGKKGRKKRRDLTGFALSDRPFASDGGRAIADLIAFELVNK